MPDARAYLEAVVDPNALGDFRLRTATLERAPGGWPKVYTGSFATTFHFETGSGDVALKCFTRIREDVERRYSEIAELLRYVRNGTLCATQYLPHGMYIAGAWWPVVMMEWVEGRPLNAEIEARLGDSDALLDLATRFRETVRSLDVLGIAHGDLQHGNILITDDRLRLIDYDAMFVPALAGLTQSEFGHRNYQHPNRRAARFDGRLDRFSSLVIYTALTALSVDRSLWERFNDGNNILFRAHDFTSAGTSQLFRTLLEHNATNVLATALLTACERGVEDVPALERVIQAAAGTMPAFSVTGRRIGTPSVKTAPPPREPRRPEPSESVSSASEQDTREFKQIPPLPPREPERAEAPITTRGRSPSGSLRFAASGAGLALMALVLGALTGFAVNLWPRSAQQAHSAPHRSVPPAVAKRSPGPAPTTKISRQTGTRPPAALVAAAAVTVPPATHVPATQVPATPVPTPVQTAARSPNAGVTGTWRIDEANTQVGTIVWAGTIARSNDGTIAMDAHKESVAGQPATPCERQTGLHAAFATNAGQQTIPYQEVNCMGATSSGVVRVTSFSPNSGSFSGSFWRDGTKLGDFEAHKQ